MSNNPGAGYTFTNLGDVSSLDIKKDFYNWTSPILGGETHPFKISAGYNRNEDGTINNSLPFKFSLSPGHIQNLVPQNIGNSIPRAAPGEFGVWVSASIADNEYPSSDGPLVFWGVKNKVGAKYVPDNSVTTGHILIGTVKIEGDPPNSVFTINQMVKSSQMTERIKFSNENSGVRYYFNRV